MFSCKALGNVRGEMRRYVTFVQVQWATTVLLHEGFRITVGFVVHAVLSNGYC